MQLVYLWVERYKAFKEQQFNFNPRYEINFDNKKSELTIKKSEKLVIDNFFCVDKGKINNLTAIVGENGTGKTTILDAIINRVAERGNEIEEPRIIVMQDSKNKLHVYYAKNKDIMVSSLEMEVEVKNWISDPYDHEDYLDTYFIYYDHLYSDFHSGDMQGYAKCVERHIILATNDILFVTYSKI